MSSRKTNYDFNEKKIYKQMNKICCDWLKKAFDNSEFLHSIFMLYFVKAPLNQKTLIHFSLK